MNITQMKKKLKTYPEGKIRFKHHAEHVRMLEREIEKELILENIKNPENLIFCEEKKAKYKNERKFDLYFQLSGIRKLRVVVTINKYLNVITTLIIHRRLPKFKAFKSR